MRIIALSQQVLAVSADSQIWVLLNATADCKRLILGTPALVSRANPIAGVVICGPEPELSAGLSAFPRSVAYGVGPSLPNIRPMVLDRPQALLDAEGRPTGLAVEVFPLSGDGLGFRLSDTVTQDFFFYLPACPGLPPRVARRLKGAALLMFDGTAYADDDRVPAGHMSMAGTDGSLVALARVAVRRRIYVQIPGTNPVLRRDSLERRMVEASGWEVGYDGMEIWL